MCTWNMKTMLKLLREPRHIVTSERNLQRLGITPHTMRVTEVQIRASGIKAKYIYITQHIFIFSVHDF